MLDFIKSHHLVFPLCIVFTLAGVVLTWLLPKWEWFAVNVENDDLVAAVIGAAVALIGNYITYKASQIEFATDEDIRKLFE